MGDYIKLKSYTATILADYQYNLDTQSYMPYLTHISDYGRTESFRFDHTEHLNDDGTITRQCELAIECALGKLLETVKGLA